MNTTEHNQTNEPGSRATDTTGTAKPAAKKTAIKSPLSTTANPINPAWSREILEAAGYPSAIAEALAEAVTHVISDEIRRKYTTAKLARIAKKAFGTLAKK